MTQEPTSFGNVLRQLRTAAARSRDVLADWAGLSLGGSETWNVGCGTPHFTAVSLQADALNLSPTNWQRILSVNGPRLRGCSDRLRRMERWSETWARR